MITFSVLTCRDCPFQKQCTTSKIDRRMQTLRPEELHDNLARARAEQKTDTWKNKYALRAGVEGTVNQALDITGSRAPFPVGTIPCTWRGGGYADTTGSSPGSCN
ncbi:transposase [Streptomyces sp. NPDC101455]|uniref:transposase n=1 Tax=Streptomyces sp. NPDC101455 TaxID=3366142 RepID=UPI00382B3CA4